MDNLEQILEKLLVNNNCLVIPGFGGFVATYQKSFYNPVKETFAPPFKRIIFNPDMVLNDGLLLNELVKAGTEMNVAQRIIQDWVKQASNQLNQHKRVEIKGVGFLFKDETAQIKFVQDNRANLLKASFGLFPVKVKLIEEKPPLGELPKSRFSPPEDRREQSVKQFLSAKSKGSLRKVMRVIPFLLLPIVVVWGWIYFTDKSTERGKQLAGFLFSSESYQPQNYQLDFLTTEKMPSIPDTAGYYLLKLADLPNVKPLVVKVEAKVDSLKVQGPVIEKVSKGSFVIVGGCFSNPINAQNFTRQLVSEGYPAQTIENSSNALTRVIFGKYNSRAEAQVFLQKIRLKYPSAWISPL